MLLITIGMIVNRIGKDIWEGCFSIGIKNGILGRVLSFRIIFPV